MTPLSPTCPFVRLLRAAGLAAVAVAFSAGAASQEVAWERMPLRPNYGDPRHNAEDLAFLPPEPGRVGGPPFRLLVAGDDLHVYDPERPTDPERDGPWVDLCTAWATCLPDEVIVTEAGSLLTAPPTGYNGRSPDGGVTWERDVASPYSLHALFQPTHAGRDGDGRAPALAREGSQVFASFDDGRAGTWARRHELGSPGALGDVVAFGEAPPSDALPAGRLLAAVFNGVSYSDDGGATWHPGAGAYGYSGYIGYGFAAVPEPGHPYGGPVLAGVDDLEFGRDSSATVYRSDDGGATWARAHRFSPAALGLPDANGVVLAATPDGAVWAGVTHRAGGPTRHWPAAVARSEDGGRTWTPVSLGLDVRSVNAMAVGPDRRLYVATSQGVWHTAGPAFEVAGEGGPEPPSEVGRLVVFPNPSGDTVTVRPASGTFGLGGASAEAGRVVVTDVRGRVVRTVALRPGVRSVTVDVSGLAAGVYGVRAEAAGPARGVGGVVATARATVVR